MISCISYQVNLYYFENINAGYVNRMHADPEVYITVQRYNKIVKNSIRHQVTLSSYIYNKKSIDSIWTINIRKFKEFLFTFNITMYVLSMYLRVCSMKLFK